MERKYSKGGCMDLISCKNISWQRKMLEYYVLCFVALLYDNPKNSFQKHDSVQWRVKEFRASLIVGNWVRKSGYNDNTMMSKYLD